MFCCENVAQGYEGVPVIENVNLELHQGETVCLLGPSGVGKTTLFNVLAGLDPCDKGKVRLAGEDITGVPGRVGYMPQKDLLLEHMTTIDNAILPLLIRGEKKNSARQYVAGFFQRFGLAGCEKKYPGQLSGGMRQRAALLRTCMTGRQIILLDEPFSALDAITRSEMQNWYMEIAVDMGLSTIFITHDVEEALLLSDTVFILNGNPGTITNTINVQPPRPRDSNFPFSVEFAQQKKQILLSIVK